MLFLNKAHFMRTFLKIGHFLFLFSQVLYEYDMSISIFLCNRSCKIVRFVHLLVSEEMSLIQAYFHPYVKYFIFIMEIKSPLKWKDSINLKNKETRNHLGNDIDVHIFTFEWVLIVTEIKHLVIFQL